MTFTGRARAAVHRVYHRLTQWYYLLVRRWVTVLFGVAYAAGIASIGHFLWRTGEYPTTWEFALLVVVLVCYLLIAIASLE